MILKASDSCDIVGGYFQEFSCRVTDDFDKCLKDTHPLKGERLFSSYLVYHSIQDNLVILSIRSPGSTKGCIKTTKDGRIVECLMDTTQQTVINNYDIEKLKELETMYIGFTIMIDDGIPSCKWMDKIRRVKGKIR